MEENKNTLDMQQMQIEAELRKLEEESLALERQLKEAEMRTKLEEERKLAEEAAAKEAERQKQLAEEKAKMVKEKAAQSHKRKQFSLIMIIVSAVVLVALLCIPKSFDIWHKAMSLFLIAFLIGSAIFGFQINKFAGAGVCSLIAGFVASLIEVVIGLEVIIQFLVVGGLILSILFFGIRYLKS